VSEPDRNGLSARLRRLPGQLLLALINATAVLVIVAAVLALVAMWRIDNFTATVVATMTEAVLSKIDLPARDVLANLRGLRSDVRALGETLKEIKARENPHLQAEVARLTEALTALTRGVDRLANARAALTDASIEQVARAVTETLTKTRACAASTGAMKRPHALALSHRRTLARDLPVDDGPL
jgi:hypothetical protein